MLTGIGLCAALLVNGGLGEPVATSLAALPPGLLAGLVALAAGRSARDHLPTERRGLRWATVFPGAGLIAIAAGLSTDPWWVPPIAAAGVVVVAPLLSDLDRRRGPRGLPPILLVTSTVGLFYTLPDPEEAALFLGVAAALSLLAVPPIRAWYGPSGSWVVAGAFVWTVAAGGYGRASAIIGGIGCLGAFVAEPIAHRMARPSGARRGTWATAIVHAASVLIAARVAGLQADPGVALTIAAANLAVVVAALAWVERSRPLRRSLGAGDQSPDERPFLGRDQTSPHEEDIYDERRDHEHPPEH
jgi:hypothetical protein